MRKLFFLTMSCVFSLMVVPCFSQTRSDRAAGYSNTYDSRGYGTGRFAGYTPPNQVAVPAQPVATPPPANQGVNPVELPNQNPGNFENNEFQPYQGFPVTPYNPPMQTTDIFASDQNLVSICQQFSQILGANGRIENGGCLAERPRQLGPVSVGDRPTRSGMVSAALFSFDAMDQNGMALNLAEVPLLSDEVFPFIAALTGQGGGIVITGLHNHWMNTNPPQIMYLHFYMVANPVAFAQRVANAWTLLKR